VQLALDVARLLGVRAGRVRQVLGPLRTAHRNTTLGHAERSPVIEDDGRQGWLDQAACRDMDPERFFPESGEHTKAAEAKAICGSCQVRDQCVELAVKAAGGLDQDHGVFGGTLPAERSQLRGARFPEPSAYRKDRDLAERAHRLASEVGLRQAARQLGVHRDALMRAFTQWGLPPPERRVGWQPSRFLTDRAEAERAFQLAQQLGSINAAAKELGTTWPSLRKAFGRHGLGMPTRNPEAVRWRAAAAARQRAGPPAAPPLDPVFVALNPGKLPARRGPQAEQGVRLRRAEEIETLSYRTVVELNAESRLAPERRVATIARRPERAQRLVNERAGRTDRRQVQRATRASHTDRPHQQERELIADAR
jgi:WhiB family transcriptional regulator, redox-sensing transcriptional regulator